MSGLEAGKYWIQNTAPPKSWIGIIGLEHQRGVVTEGRINVWNVEKLANGNYTFFLEDAGHRLFIQNDDGKLVVNEPPSEWTIRGLDNGLYTIAVPGDFVPPKAWTMNTPELAPKTAVTLNTLEDSQPKQQWNFISWPGPVQKQK